MSGLPCTAIVDDMVCGQPFENECHLYDGEGCHAYVAPAPQPCVWCDGQGFISATGVMCRTCHGSGVPSLGPDCPVHIPPIPPAMPDAPVLGCDGSGFLNPGMRPLSLHAYCTVCHGRGCPQPAAPKLGAGDALTYTDDDDVFTACERCGRYAPEPEDEGDDSYCRDCTALINVEYERDQRDLQVAYLRERLAEEQHARERLSIALESPGSANDQLRAENTTLRSQLAALTTPTIHTGTSPAEVIDALTSEVAGLRERLGEAIGLLERAANWRPSMGHPLHVAIRAFLAAGAK